MIFSAMNYGLNDIFVIKIIYFLYIVKTFIDDLLF